jgi:S1-C subfamily serine protease
MSTRVLRGVAVLSVVLSSTACGAPPGPPVATPREATVAITADGCPDVDAHGVGLVVAPGRVLTVAHVVAGATAVTVRSGTGDATAQVVAFDPDNDAAVLAIDRGIGRPIPLGPAKVGRPASVAVFRNGVLVEQAVTILRRVSLQTEDIYVQGRHDRPSFELDADIQPGDSGSVVVQDRRAVAIVWARTRGVERRAWALDSSIMEMALRSPAPVAHGHCTG